jgi:hypothetical protein
MGKNGKERKRRRLEAAKLQTPPSDDEQDVVESDFLLGLVSRIQLQTTVHTLNILAKHQIELKDAKSSDLKPLKQAAYEWMRTAQAASGEGQLTCTLSLCVCTSPH